MGRFFRDGYILILLFYCFIASIFLFHIELTMKHQNFKARIFIEKNKAILLSCETTPNNIVKLKISNISIIEFLLRIKPKLILKCNNSHFLSFHLQKFCFQWLLPQLQRILLRNKFETAIGKHMVRDSLISSYQQHIWIAYTSTYYPGIALNML